VGRSGVFGFGGVELTAQEVWSRVLRDAEAAIPAQSFETWLAGTAAVGISEEELIVEAPSQFHVEWLEDKYESLLTDLLARTLGRPLRLSMRPSSVDSALAIPSLELAGESPGPGPGPGSRSGPGSHPQLNDRYTFESFVVGSDNELASAASHAVAQQPAIMYNPLFIYGGVGLGKTHLMHAIGNAIVASFPRMRVAYLSSEQFTNDLVTAIQNGRTDEFRRRYRLMDLLLVDDVQFLQGKERTQEEFFHTFNALYDAKKQIVLTCDRPPKDMGDLEERLVSRFEWGLVADIRPPDYETRVAILRKKAHRDGLVLDDSVIDFVARSCTSSVRELEGAVIKLLAFSSLTHREIDDDLARTALRGIGRPEAEAPALSAERIREAVANEFGVSTASLSSKRRTRNLTVPRQVAMYLIKELLDPPLVLIGHMFGGRDHSTVIHSIKKVEQTLDDDDSFERRVERVRKELGA
jgi:chromosomal replication initiator protein